jgi:hypothetical protein
VWWDHRNLRGSQRFRHVIEEAISTARVVIVVWSKTSTESRWVWDEATVALEKKLVSLRIDMADPPMGFRSIHTVDLSSWTGQTEAEPFERLVEDLGHYLGPPNSSDKSEHPAIPPVPHTRTATTVEEDQQPMETAPIAEHSHASPNNSSPLTSSITTQPTSITGPSSWAGRKHVGKYFAAIAVTVGVVVSVVWSMEALKNGQPPPVKPPTELDFAHSIIGRVVGFQ